MKTLLKALISGAIILAAIAVVAWRYWDYLANPWTRDGQVRAQVVQIAPRVSGPIVQLPIADNQRIEAGDLLFQIDPRVYNAQLAQAQAGLDQTQDEIAALQQQIEEARAAVDLADAAIAQVNASLDGLQARVTETATEAGRVQTLLQDGNVAQRTYDEAAADADVAQSNLAEAQDRLLQANAQKAEAQAALAAVIADLGTPGDDNPRLRAAQAALQEAQLNLEFTRVEAPVSGYVTNLTLQIGSQAVADQPSLALINSDSFWVHGFFRETVVAEIQPGNRAIVTLMSYPGRPLEGRVDSIGWGISRQDGSTGYDLLPDISPSFDWIRLAQRVPVRVELTDVPDDVTLRVGTTASVLVMTGTTAGEETDSVAAAPAFLQ
ncbi:MAG: biotin/lipoyl-binding protein [Alphaproteobacteria bacterium]|jgi:multidrug resistance efflux pump|nr:biotin/lipoyl-binding protein [Alphaproteobacteria bacterium]